MICYLDTSALVKLYVAEEGNSTVHQHLESAALVATSKVAYPEACAAFARSFREDCLIEKAYKIALANFKSEWPSYYILEFTDSVMIKAGELAEKYSLRGFDAIHMASALTLSDYLSGKDEETIEVGCWDKKLAEAFKLAGLAVFP